MRCACFIVLIAAAVISAQPAEVQRKFSQSEEFQNIVNYLNENASGNDMVDILESFSDILDDVTPEERVGDELFHEIPWFRINLYVQGKMFGDAKFAKINSMLNDPEFKDLLNKAVNTKFVQANGFTFSNFVTFAFKAICDTAIVSHQDVYSEGVCLALANL